MLTELVERAPEVIFHFIYVRGIFATNSTILRQERKTLRYLSARSHKSCLTYSHLGDHMVSIVGLSLHSTTYGGDGKTQIDHRIVGTVVVSMK